MTTTELQRYRNKKRRDLNRSRGIPNRLAPDEARAHLALLRQTMSWDRIATESGCSACYLRNIAAGRVPKINSVTHNKILSVRPAASRNGGFYIDATGSVRRVRALMARGHAQHTIAAAADTTQYRISLLANGQQRMRQKLADKIDRAYRLLADKDGTSERARQIAAGRNWRDAQYWEDMGGIDDPAAPETENPLSRDELARVIAEEIRHLAGFGISPTEIAKKVGRSESYVKQQINGERGPGWRQQLEAAA